MKVKEESRKVGLKLKIQRTKILASGPITSWEIDGEKWKQWQTLFWGSEITADGDCSHEIKDACSLEETYDQPRQNIKNRDINLPTKVHLVKPMDFLVVMYRCESWTIKKA